MVGRVVEEVKKQGLGGGWCLLFFFFFLFGRLSLILRWGRCWEGANGVLGGVWGEG